MLQKLSRLIRRIAYGKPIVIVSGLPRSGTSMAMKMLEAGGVPLITDGLRTADEDNPKGYYEDERVKDLARMTDKSWLTAARGRGIKIISHLLRELPATNNYQVVFVRRDLTEVLASQAKMLDRRGEDSVTEDERMKQLFEADLWRARYLLRNGTHFDWIELDHREFIDNPRRQAERIRDFLGMSLDLDAMTAVVDPDLHRNVAERLAPVEGDG
jgi:hypothetical protein